MKFHWNFCDISLKFQWHFTEMLENFFTEISVIFHSNFSDISLKCWRIISPKFQCYFTEILENSFTDISVKCQWNFTEIIHTPQDPNDKKINKQEQFAIKNKQHLLQKLRYNTCICKLCPLCLMNVNLYNKLCHFLIVKCLLLPHPFQNIVLHFFRKNKLLYQLTMKTFETVFLVYSHCGS